LMICLVAGLLEILDYANKAMIRDLRMALDLPLQICHFGYYGAMLALLNKKQLLFEFAYIVGFTGAFQAIITTSLHNVPNLIGVFTSHMQHSMIILMVVWLMSAHQMELRFRGVFCFFVLLNLLSIPIIGINHLIDGNYFFLRSPPLVDNPLLPQVWPDYIILTEIILIPYSLLLYLPFYLRRTYRRFRT